MLITTDGIDLAVTGFKPWRELNSMIPWLSLRKMVKFFFTEYVCKFLYVRRERWGLLAHVILLQSRTGVHIMVPVQEEDAVTRF